jgi:hypothetical protein
VLDWVGIAQSGEKAASRTGPRGDDALHGRPVHAR